MSDKEITRSPSIPAPAAVPRPSAAPPGGRAPRTRTSTLQGPASVPSPARSVPPAPPPPTEFPKPGRLPGAELLDGGPPPIPALETPLPAVAAAAPISDGPRRRSRRTVQIPNDATPMSTREPTSDGERTSDPSRVSDPGERTSSPDSLPEPAMDFVIQPMRIISIASDLPAVEAQKIEPVDEPTPVSAEPISAAEASVPSAELPPVSATNGVSEHGAVGAVAASARAEEDVVEVEPDRESDPASPKRASEGASAEDIPVDVEDVELPAAPKKPPPPPPRVRAGESSASPPPPPPASTKTPPPISSPPAVAAPVSAPPVASTPTPPPVESKKRAKAWWDDLFDDDFLRTMDRVEPKVVTREVDFIEQSLGLEKGAVVLDLACGMGLQAVELASRGYTVVGYDLSLAMLARAADEAQSRAQRINFLQGDMREMAFDEMFDAVYCWSTSFGYFDEEKNQEVLLRAHRALRPGGLLLLDLSNRDYLASRSPSLVWFEGEGCVCMDEMHVDFFTSRLRVKRTAMFEDGRSREVDYSIRLYALHEIGQMLHDTGYKVVEVTGHPAHQGVFFGAESPRLIVLAERS